MIFDAHVHVFRVLRGTIAAGPVTAQKFGRVRMGREDIQMLPPISEATTFTAEALVASMDWARVDRAMLLQGPFYGDQNFEVLDAVKRYPNRLVGALYVDPWANGARDALARLTASNGFRAAKLECSLPTGLCGLHPDARLDDPDIAWYWEDLERCGMVLVIDLGAVGSRSYQTTAMRTIARNHPSLKIVIAHLGQIRPPVIVDASLMQQWQEQIDLGQLDNVWFDCASLPAYCIGEDYPYPSVGECLRWAIDRIGPQKILWGSDVPGVLGQMSYRQLVGLGVLHSRFLAPDEQAMFLFGNALRVFGQESNENS